MSSGVCNSVKADDRCIGSKDWGALPRDQRRLRRLSQIDLACEADISRGA